MKRIFFLSILTASTLFFTSCQKDSSDTGSGNSDIAGDYKFISLDAATKSTVQYSDGINNIKTITTSDYKTLDNTGDIKIDADKMTTVNMAYRIADTANAEFYEDGVFIDSFESPFEATTPAFNSTATYKKIGTDSIYFDNGSFLFIQTGTTTPGQPNGMKYRFENNKLIFYSSVTETKTVMQQGIPMNVKNEVVFSVNLEKK